MTPPLLEALFSKNFKETSFVYKKTVTLALQCTCVFPGIVNSGGQHTQRYAVKIARVKLAIDKKRLARVDVYNAWCR